MFISLLAGTSGVYRLVFTADVIPFIILIAQSVIYVYIGLRIRESAGGLNLVSVRPEEIASHFEIPKAFGLGRHATIPITFCAGAAASAAIIVLTGLLGFITARALLLAIAVFALYGGLLALAKRRWLRKGKLRRQQDGYVAAHRRISVIAVPTIVVVWAVATLPEANPGLLAVIMLGLLFWIGQLYHHLWEVLHTGLLALFYGENDTKTIEWGLMEWLRYTRRDVEAIAVDYDPQEERVRVIGHFTRPDDLRSDLLRLDFIKRVHLVEQSAVG